MNPAQWMGTGIATVSLMMAASLGVAYPFYRDAYLSLTFQQPFADWGGVRKFYQDTAGKTCDAHLSLLARDLGWCNKSSPRPYVDHANRSEACACLHLTLRGFLNETYGQAVPAATANDYGERALACMRYRAVWDVWGCESCMLHPVALALALNGSLGLLAGAAVLLGLGAAKPLVGAIALALVAAGAAPLVAFHWQANLLFCVLLLAVFVAIVYSLEDDLAATAVDEYNVPLLSRAPAPPEGLHVAFWWGMPLFTSLHVAYMLASHLVRDVPALLGGGLLGFLCGLLAQRVYWTRIYLRDPAYVEQTFGRWSARVLTFALVVAWVGVWVLLYTNLHPHGPYAGWWASMVGACLVMVTHLLVPLAGRSAVGLVLLANLLVGVIALVDAAR